MATKQVEHHDDVLAMFSNGPIKQLGERNQSNVAQRGRMEMASQVTASMELTKYVPLWMHLTTKGPEHLM